MVVLENWVAFRSYFPDYEDAVISICRDSVAAGISFVVTVAQGNGAGFKLVSNFSKRTALYCNDSSDYGTIFESCRKKIPDIPGRAIVEANKTFYECQYYLSFPAEKEYEKISLIREFIKQVAEKYEGMYVKGIPLHQIIVTSVLRTDEDVARLQRFNRNATENSCHRYGTTFDIGYNRYKTVSTEAEPRRQVRNDTLKWVLAEVLRDKRAAGRCYIKHEVKQGCFHITVR